MSPLLLGLLAALRFGQVATAATLSVASSGGNATSPYQYGIMFEDISHSGDGGLYAELIQNRAFQNATLEAWNAVGDATLSLDTSNPLSSALPNSVKVTSSAKGLVGLSNPGWWGINTKATNTYSGSFYSLGDFEGEFTASIISDITSEVLASVKIPSKSRADDWTKHTYQLRPFKDASNSNNSFVLSYEADAGTELNFNLISLFPPTYKNRANGNRADLMQILKDLNPNYLRAPGGNNLEGNYSPDYWNWSATIGPLEDRPGREGTWGYYNTDGLGLVEYMNWCTDLGIEPVLAVWAGLYLDGEVVSESDLEFYVQDALNELEFLMGDTSTYYGRLRASLGYPEPWTIKFVEVGNEDELNGGSASYNSYRFNMFYDAITEAYPDILVMSSTTTYKYESSGWDYHEYTRPDYFVSQFGYFDNWTSNPIMIGEYASVQNNTGVLEGTDWSLPKNQFTYWIGAVSEAVFLLGAERNSDKIFGASFAPLFQNLNSYEWTPDLISFTADPAQTVLSVSYSVIKLFSNNRMTHTLPVSSPAAYGPAYWAAGQDASSYILKAAVYNSTGEEPFSVSFPGVRHGARAQLTVISADDPFARNTPANPDVLKTTVTEIAASGDGTFDFSLPNLSVAVLVAPR